MASPKKEYERCGALTVAGTPCKYPAGRKTDHVGAGKCHLHGGASPGAPEGNKNALTHGAYETLYEELFTANENTIRNEADVTPLSQARREIRLLEVREYRMLRRIKDLRDRIAAGDDLVAASVETQNGWNVKGKVDMRIVHRETIEASLARYEAALTTVQKSKLEWVNALHKYEQADPPQDDPLMEFMGSMREAQAEWDEENPEEDE